MALEISIVEQAKIFKQHLDEVGNDRIIFSGAFGKGKTYFLDKYFNAPESECLAIKLAPVNYSISSNEDIFQLIKYDILFELAAIHNIPLEGEQISWDVALGVILPAKADSIIQSFIPLLPLLNKPTDAIPLVFTALTAWLATGKEITKQRKEASQETEMISFGEAVAAKYQLELDYVTTFLENGLNKVAEEQNKRCKVLIIDDLDRIDPEHIFRLFNIFSAHLDYHKSSHNKFGFDKVIFVCDISNIRNIFHSKYGTDTDFTGYIDKFFSKEIYHFSNEQEMRDAVDNVINSFNFQKSQDEYFQQAILQGIDYRDKGLLYVVLVELLISGALRIRRLEESYGREFLLPTKNLIVNVPDYGAQQISYRYLPALVTIEILSKIVGGGEALLNAVDVVIKCRKSSDYRGLQNDKSQWLIGNLIPIIDYDIHNFKKNSFGAGTTYEFKYTPQQQIRYELLLAQSKSGYYFGKVINNVSLDLFIVFHRAIEVLLKDGLLR
ncbi:MAG: P-loop NTPase fold protein [Janthinobacterium lividum]